MRLTRPRLFLALLLAAVAVVLGWREHETRALEGRLAAIAGEIAGREVRVECQGSVGAALDVTGEAGSVEFDADGRPGDVTSLKRDICARLDRFRGEHHDARFDCLASGSHCPQDAVRTLHALQTLAHEAWHLAGTSDEAITECYAVQTTALVAVRLGASPPVAQAAARAVLAQIYPQMPAEYRSSDCRDGGRLDLRPDMPVWP